MANNEHLSLETDRALRAAAKRFEDTVEIPCYLPEADRFLTAYFGEALARNTALLTLVTGFAGSLAVSAQDKEYSHLGPVNVDLPGDGPAVIVRPGFYDEHGNPSREGKLARPIYRALTEAEGRGLSLDLYSIIANIPPERRRA